MASDPKSQPGGQPKLTPRQLAAQARAEQEAALRRRDRMLRTIGALLVLALVGGVIAIGYYTGRARDEAAAGPTPNPSAALPAGVRADTFGVPYGTGWTGTDADKLPTLEIWEDFQCPACAAVEAAVGDQIKKLGEDGLVKLLFRPTIFIDRSYPNSLNASARATNAWGCAIDAGKASEYHSGVFSIQPATEGDGWTDQQLLDLAATVGIEGDELTTFNQCVADGTYMGWAANSGQKFADSGARGTPTAFLDGAELGSGDLVDIEGLKKKIAAATKE
ncbi:MAG: thioredoxin domain-containing protein [Candidatus Nanopelagicales bacterium]